ncbi:MAG TPA: hypothetical protein VGS80_03825 [Ktedonobacterales bacterium]|nr:hypothetical protein [Ktedonobacterales bacterium]
MQGMHVERLDHVGIVARICREIALAKYLDALAGESMWAGTSSTMKRTRRQRL